MRRALAQYQLLIHVRLWELEPSWCSGYFDDKLETFVEIPSDNCPFNEKPDMKAREITEAGKEALLSEKFQMVRINFANPGKACLSGANPVETSFPSEALRNIDQLTVYPRPHPSLPRPFLFSWAIWKKSSPPSGWKYHAYRGALLEVAISFAQYYTSPMTYGWLDWFGLCRYGRAHW